MQTEKLFEENLKQEDVIGYVTSGSTTMNVKANLVGNDFPENTKVFLSRTYKDGTEEVGIGRIGGYLSDSTLPGSSLSNEVDHLNSIGIPTPGQNSREKIYSSIDIQCVVVKVPGYIPEINGSFKNVPPKGTEIRKFAGFDQDVEENNPREVSIFGFDIASNIPNINYLSSSTYLGEGRNKLVVGPMGSGKSVVTTEISKQNINTKQNFIYFDTKNEYVTTEINNFDIKAESLRADRECVFINTKDIKITPSLQNIKNVAKQEGLYKYPIIPADSTKTGIFIDNVLEQLHKKKYFDSLNNNDQDVLFGVLDKYTKKENTFFNRIYDSNGSAKKTKLKEFLDDINEFKKLKKLLDEIRERFIFDENSHSVISILNKLCNENKVTVVFHSDSGSNDKYMVNAISELLKSLFLRVHNSDRKIDIAIICDEAQETFVRKIDNEPDELKNGKASAIKYAIKIMSKLRAKGVQMWFATPSISQVNSEIIKLAGMHEKYLCVGIGKSDREKLFDNVPENVMSNYETLSFPKRHKDMSLKTVYVLLIGQHTPYEPQGKGHLIRLCFDKVIQGQYDV